VGDELPLRRLSTASGGLNVTVTETEPTLDIREALEGLDAPELEEAVNRRQALGERREDGLVPLFIIRPGIGRGKGKHLYEADMLQREVADGRFKGWKMYVDHQASEAKKASGGLPRSIRDLGGFVKEAWWDPAVPADLGNGWGEGAVVGLAKPTRLMRDLIEDIPEAIGASISARATEVRPVQRDGHTVWLVEGIRPKGSVDWVTEAGAGGRVAQIMESLDEAAVAADEEELMLEGKTDDELVEWLAENRPALLGQYLQEDEDGDELLEAGDGDELAELTEKFTKKFKGNRRMAEMAAKRALKAKKAEEQAAGEGGEAVDAETLREALDTDEGRQVIAEAVDERVDERFAAIVAPRLSELIEAALEDEREMIQAEAEATSSRKLQLRDLRDQAHEAIRESRLPEAFQSELLERYDIIDGQPTPALDVLDEEDDQTGEVVKPAEEVLMEAVKADVARKKEQYAAARPTQVRGQGEAKPAKSAGKTDDVTEGEETTERKTPASTGSPRTDAILSEAGIENDDELYAGITGQ
jgi:hypothetical protein